MKFIILSGGGSKGNYQRGVLKNFNMDEYGLVAGTSVGSLNGLGVAMEEFQALDDIWSNIKNKDVYKGRLNVLYILKALFCKKNYILDQEPLEKLLKKFRGKVLKKDYVCNIVDLKKERQQIFFFKAGSKVNSEMIDAVLASSAMPVIFKPVNKSWVDGGVVSNSLLGDILDSVPYGRDVVDEILAVNCGVRTTTFIDFSNLPKMLESIFDKILTNLMHDDIEGFIKKNKEIKDGKYKDTKYKYIPLKLIEPSKLFDVRPWDFNNCHKLFDIGLTDGNENVKNY